MKEGTPAVLLQSGLDKEWWADSMECYTYLQNMQDLLSVEKTPHQKRFGMPFNGPVIPFGAMVEYHPISAKDQSRLHQFGAKVLPGVFLGYVLYAGGIWKGDIMIADTEELEEMDASEILARRMTGDKFIFPVADGTVKTPGGDRRLRPSTLIRDHPERGEEQEVFRGESDGLSSPTPLQDDSTAEARNEFWSITGDFMYRHHVEPRVKLYMPKEESIPISMKYIDVTRKTRTSLEVLLENRLMVTGTLMERELSDAWTALTRFISLNERLPDGYTWSGRRLTRTQTTSRPDNVWPDVWKHMSDAAKSKAKQKWCYRETKARKCQTYTWYLLHGTRR